MKNLMICFAFFLCLALPPPAQAQRLVSGQVTDVEDNGIEGVRIDGKLTCIAPTFGTVTYTDSRQTGPDGKYTLFFSGAPSGSGCMNPTVSAVASKPGYAFGATSSSLIVMNFIGIELPQFFSVSAADYRAFTASEMIASGFADSLATTIESATSVPLPTTLAGRSVLVKDKNGVEKSAQLFFVSPNQINYIIPPGLAEGTAVVKVGDGARLVRAGLIEIQRVAPSIFTVTLDGKGIPSAFVQRQKSDGASTYELIAQFDPALSRFVAIPIDLGPETDQVFLGLLGTGWRNRSSLQAVTARIGGTPVEALYAGLQPTLPGVDQINLRLPRSLAGRGEVDVEIVIDGKVANIVKIDIR